MINIPQYQCVTVFKDYDYRTPSSNQNWLSKLEQIFEIIFGVIVGFAVYNELFPVDCI
jgi:hypothetical protein